MSKAKIELKVNNHKTSKVKSNIIWFNPLFGKTASEKNGKYFFKSTC